MMIHLHSNAAKTPGWQQEPLHLPSWLREPERAPEHGAHVPEQHVYPLLRRALDIAVSVLALSAFALLLPLIAAAIKLDSPGPVFYHQWRVGMNRRRHRGEWHGPDRRRIVQPGTPIRIVKLRTMRTDAERHGPQLAADGDSRITRVGRFLRASRLDEVPQFWNVLKGEMSLIGPRPERLVFVNQYERLIPRYTDRLRANPGITGLAQVRNGYDDDLDSVRRKVALDRLYIRSIGWRMDLRILLETVRVVLTGDGAR